VRAKDITLPGALTLDLSLTGWKESVQATTLKFPIVEPESKSNTGEP